MFLSSKQKSLILVMLSSISLYSCGMMKKSNDTNTQQQDVPVPVPTPTHPAVSLSATGPSDVLYVATVQQKSLMQASGKLAVAPTAKLFEAKGDGGLGEDLNDVDSLSPYLGIPISIQKTDISDDDAKSINVTVTATGDTACGGLFTYDATNSQVAFGDTSKINSLTICNVQVAASAAVQGKVVQDQKSFTVSVNPTLAAYAQNNDPVVNFMETKTAVKDLNLIAQWLKKPEQTMNLKIDPLLITDKIENLNALTGAQNIKALDLSGTSLKDVRALLYFSQLQKLDLSDTKIDPKDLVQLAQLKKLTSLSVRNLSLKDLTFITNNIPNLTELDISGNTQIEDLSDIKNLKNLLVLKASNIGFTNFDQLAQITQINTLDISGNDLSKLSDKDMQNLVNIYSLSSLNISGTHISDDFLNKYFGAVSKRNNLTTFIDRNSYNRSVVGGCENINNFDIATIPNLSNLTNLTYLDLHGNGCNDTGVSQKGLTKTFVISSLSKLETLDISDTVVMDLSGVNYNNMPNLKKLILVDAQGNGISMNKDQCAYYIGTTDRGADCNKLPGGSAQSHTFALDEKSWTVPNNVHSVKITGCSGANSGAQGGGAGAGATVFYGDWWMSSWGGDGASSGNVNGQSNAVGGGAGTVGNHCNTSSGACVRDHQAGSGSAGADGGVGTQTSFGSQVFSTASPYVSRDPSIACVGGSNGGGGAGGNGSVNGAGHGGAGGTNATTPWSSKIETYTLSVNPGDKIPVNVGVAGTEPNNGGGGGGSQGDGGHDAGASQAGFGGGAGTPGTNGYLKLEWSQ